MQVENQKYFLLNINEGEKGKRENNVKDWIERKRFAPIFFYGHTIDQIGNKNKVSIKDPHHTSRPHKHKDAETFVDTFLRFPDTDDKIVLSIGNEKIYFFKQADKLVPFDTDNEGGVKGFPIKYINDWKIKECPLVLASMKVNQHFAMGTFKEVKLPEYFGNIQAIKYLLSGDKQPIFNFSNYLKCLSSVEFETLIAKILEEKGLFVPAYKRGFIKNFDLKCCNFGENPIEIGKEKIKSADTKLIQNKLMLKKKDYIENDDYIYFCIKSELEKENVFVAEDIEELLDKSEKTSDWLKKSLYWTEFVKNG